jgi:hypothetical protein
METKGDSEKRWHRERDRRGGRERGRGGRYIFY